MSAISPSTTSTPSSKTTKELSAPDLNVKIKIEPKDDSNNISTPIRKSSEETFSTSSSDSSVEVSVSPVPLTSKEKSTKPFGSFNTTNSSSNNIEGPSEEKDSNSNANEPSSPNQQQSSIVSNKKSEFSYFKVGVSEDRNKRCRRTMEVNDIFLC
jgi:hypothetical protein